MRLTAFACLLLAVLCAQIRAIDAFGPRPTTPTVRARCACPSNNFPSFARLDLFSQQLSFAIAST